MPEGGKLGPFGYTLIPDTLVHEFEIAREAASGSGGRTVVAASVGAAHKEMKKEAVTKLQEASKLALQKTKEKRVVPQSCSCCKGCGCGWP